MKPALIGVCDVCKEKAPLIIEHDHRSWFYMVRGFVCLRCNGIIGRLEKKGRTIKGRDFEKYMPYILYIANPPLAYRRVNYHVVKGSVEWFERRSRMMAMLQAEAVSRPTYA